MTEPRRTTMSIEEELEGDLGTKRMLVNFGPQHPATHGTLRNIIELISDTATSTGLSIQAGHDPNWYPTGVKISDDELAALPLHPHDFHGEWNYTITAQSDPT